jgi:hypothetical protein
MVRVRIMPVKLAVTVPLELSVAVVDALDVSATTAPPAALQ